MSEVAGRAWTSVAELNVAVAARLPRTAMTVRSADSQETVGSNGRAVNVLDGNPATIWHTEWQAADPPPPHEIQLDLGRTAAVSCVFYQPRPDHSNGRIGDYEVHTSTDGTTWGTAAATGTWIDTPPSGTGVLQPAQRPLSAHPRTDRGGRQALDVRRGAARGGPMSRPPRVVPRPGAVTLARRAGVTG